MLGQLEVLGVFSLTCELESAQKLFETQFQIQKPGQYCTQDQISSLLKKLGGFSFLPSGSLDSLRKGVLQDAHLGYPLLTITDSCSSSIICGFETEVLCAFLK